MLELMDNLQAYCEGRWVSKLSAHTLSPVTCQPRAQVARERRERRESSPNIRQRIPKLKVQAYVLLSGERRPAHASAWEGLMAASQAPACMLLAWA